MSACEQLAADASAGVAPALRAVDCLSGELTAAAFGRLFGPGGALLPVLTIVLTLYIALFALALLTGRGRIGISALTPRMMTLGLVLTFATSWAAYQGVVWNLATGAPDQIAGVLMGAKGSATQLFADRLDMVFAAIADAAETAGQAQGVAGGGPGGGAVGGGAGSFSPGNLMWLSALLLLLGTVGVLVTARIALAVLLALGPVFVVFGLFPGTRGLAAGWLRAVVLTAAAPLFVVLAGGLMLELLVPVVAGLRLGESVDGRASMALFLIAAVHVALMAMVMKVAGTLVSGWRVFGLAASPADARDDPPAARPVEPLASEIRTAPLPEGRTVPGRQAGAAAQASAEPALPPSAPTAGRTITVRERIAAAPGAPALPVLRDTSRARGIGSRFRSAAVRPGEMMR